MRARKLYAAAAYNGGRPRALTEPTTYRKALRLARWHKAYRANGYGAIGVAQVISGELTNYTPV